jgi:hypothetical protein
MREVTPLSTHLVVDPRGKLQFLSLCPILRELGGEKVLIARMSKQVREKGVVKAFEDVKYKY